MKKLSLLIPVLAILFITSCSEDCETVCNTGEVLTNDCECLAVDPCAGVTCAVGEILTSDCDCVDSAANLPVIVSGELSANSTWTSDKIYELANKVVVSSGVTLTIEPGTIIKGREGSGSSATALVVAKGGKIEACGTSSNPIIFTSVLDNISVGQTAGTNLNESQVGLWGGLIVLGNAPSSFEGDPSELQIEGIPADDAFGLYGGDDPDDNSGSLCYISVRHGGALIGSDNEINGITLGGVGRGTTINNVEVVANKDDGIEFFGGTVNVTNAIVWSQGDDAFDVDQAYSGTLDNYVSIAGPDSDHSLEIDGPEGTATGRFTFTNGTHKGFASEFADFRKSAMGTVSNTYFFGFPEDADFEIDDDESSMNVVNGILEFANLEFNTTKTIAEICLDKAPSGDQTAFAAYMEQNASVVSTPSVGADTSVFGWTYTAQKNALNF
jgi:hypothetical protein